MYGVAQLGFREESCVGLGAARNEARPERAWLQGVPPPAPGNPFARTQSAFSVL